VLSQKTRKIFWPLNRGATEMIFKNLGYESRTEKDCLKGIFHQLIICVFCSVSTPFAPWLRVFSVDIE